MKKDEQGETGKKNK